MFNQATPFVQISEKKEPKKVCQLYCHVYGTSAYYKLSSKVEDGTPCSEETSNICVDGQCLVSIKLYACLKDSLLSVLTNMQTI